jgi:IS30 family transposase
VGGARRRAGARYLTVAERGVIADGIRAGSSQKDIAEQLGRSRATISRELARNRDPDTGQYRPSAAHIRGRSPRLIA